MMQQKKNLQPKDGLDFLFDKFLKTSGKMLFAHRLAHFLWFVRLPINELKRWHKNNFIFHLLLSVKSPSSARCKCR